MKRKTAIIVLLLCLFAGVAAFLIIDNRKGVTGNHTANRDAHSPDMEYVDGTYLYTLGQRADKMLQIQFEIKRGAVQMKMKAPDGATLYINYYLYRGSFVSLFPPFFPEHSCRWTLILLSLPFFIIILKRRIIPIPLTASIHGNRSMDSGSQFRMIQKTMESGWNQRCIFYIGK